MSLGFIILISLAQIIPILLLIYFYIKHKQSYWQRAGIPGPKPIFLLGHQPKLVRTGHANTELKWSRKYGKLYGVYHGLSPVLTTTDVDLIKQIMVKDFPLFVNRRVLRFEDIIWNKNLFNQEDEHWKKIRSITSPTFTTGKLRSMYRLMSECIDQLNEHLRKVATINGGQIDAKQVITGFTIDVIARTSFATKTNSNASDLVDRNNNSFVYHGINIFRIDPFRSFSGLTMPLWFNRMLGITHFFSVKSFDFFVQISREIIHQRKQEKNDDGRKRHDLIQLMMDSYVDEETLKRQSYDQLTASIDEDTSSSHIQSNGNGTNNGKKTTPTSIGNQKRMTENEIIAQCILFFTAGFETTATTLIYTLYELAINPDVQVRLAAELHQALDGVTVDTEQYYDIVLNRIPYLDAVQKETLRKYPPVPRLERRAAKDGYILGGVRLHKDQLVEVSTYAVHHSPEYYPEPERYNPDRFMPKNKHLLVPYTYLPFGIGPRNCVGMRFAYQEIKLCLAKVIRKFCVLPSEDTPVPLEFSKTGFLLSIDRMPLKVEQRC